MNVKVVFSGLSLLFILATPVHAYVDGISGWVISGATGLPDPTNVSQNQFQFGIGFSDSDPNNGTYRTGWEPTVYYHSDFSFGYVASAAGVVIASQSWPPLGYVSSGSSDQFRYLTAVDLRGLNPGTTYTVALWAIDGGSYFDNSFTVTTLPAIASVPETETYAMLLAGLGLFGSFARRRKQQQASA